MFMSESVVTFFTEKEENHKSSNHELELMNCKDKYVCEIYLNSSYYIQCIYCNFSVIAVKNMKSACSVR